MASLSHRSILTPQRPWTLSKSHVEYLLTNLVDKNLWFDIFHWTSLILTSLWISDNFHHLTYEIKLQTKCFKSLSNSAQEIALCLMKTKYQKSLMIMELPYSTLQSLLLRENSHKGNFEGFHENLLDKKRFLLRHQILPQYKTASFRWTRCNLFVRCG